MTDENQQQNNTSKEAAQAASTTADQGGNNAALVKPEYELGEGPAFIQEDTTPPDCPDEQSEKMPEICSECEHYEQLPGMTLGRCNLHDCKTSEKAKICNERATA